MSSNDPSSNDRPEPVHPSGKRSAPPPAVPPGSAPPPWPGQTTTPNQGLPGTHPPGDQIPVGAPPAGQGQYAPQGQYSPQGQYPQAQQPGYQQPYHVDQQPPVAAPYAHQGDSTGGVIPYKNPKALIAYYLGIAALLPLLGIPAAPVALVLGIMGLVARKRNPIIKGSIHAWVGIVFGLLGLLIQTCVVIGLIGVIFEGTGNNLGQFEMPPE